MLTSCSDPDGRPGGRALAEVAEALVDATGTARVRPRRRAAYER
ncbi:MAG: hypothetical protein R2713_15750 [Ilumatobacteraceae bacterium]